MTDWIYQGSIFTSDDIKDYYGFVYRITNLSNNKMYIGKKFFWNRKRLPPLKGRKNKRNKLVESDWKQYYGSSDEVKNLVEETGHKNFKREILFLCRSKGECAYIEAKLQFDYNVLLSDKYYNEFIGCKIHSAHIKQMKNDYGSDGSENT
jgi:hypothetical protein